MKTWKSKLEDCIEGIDKEMDDYVQKAIDEEVADVVGDISFYPAAEKPGVLVMWAAEDERNKINLKKRFKEWFDDEDGEYIATKPQLEAWAAHLDDVAKMVRGLAVAGKYKGGPKYKG